MAYLPQIDVAVILENGIRSPLRNTDVDVYDVTTSTSLGTFNTDDAGVLAEDDVGGVAGDVVELSVSGLSLVQRFTLGATQADAYIDNVTAYIAEDESTEELEATEIDIYVKEEGSDEAWTFLGSGRPGTTPIFPYQTSVTKTLLVKGVPKSDSFLKTENSLTENDAVSVVITATKGQITPIFDRSEDATTTGTVEETLYSDEINASTFVNVGDEVRITYRCTFEKNTNNKQFIVYVDGNPVIDTGTITTNDGTATIEVSLMLNADGDLRVLGEYRDADNEILFFNDLVVDVEVALSVELAAITATTGDITARFAKALFIPATSIAFHNVLYLGDNVTYLGDQVIY